ncbi:hypothetical protein J4219_07235 [Candidatus Woesearchaeota archaeon]|nr:hypothetical protein [Candidatus Woesearchaeota archaeon]
MPVAEENDIATYLVLVKSLNAILTNIRIGQGPLDVVESVKKQLLVLDKLPREDFDQRKILAEARQRLFDLLKAAALAKDNRTVLIAYIRTLGILNANIGKMMANPIVLGQLRGVLTSAMSVLESMTPIGAGK